MSRPITFEFPGDYWGRERIIESCNAWALEEGITPMEKFGREQAGERITAAYASNSTDLHLSGLGLTSLPPCFGELTELRRLHLNQNNFTSLPPEVYQLYRLELLNISGNQLTSLPPEITRLSRLKTLHLFYNQITSIPPEAGGWLCALSQCMFEPQTRSAAAIPRTETALDGGEAASSKLAEKLFNHINLIKSCKDWASEEGISDLEKSKREEAKGRIIFANSTDQPYLNLSDLGLRSLPSRFGELTKLKSLYLRGNKFTSLPPEICKLSGLEHLNLNENQLASIPPEIKELSNLKTLHLLHNQITSIPPDIAVWLRALPECRFEPQIESAAAIPRTKTALDGGGAASSRFAGEVSDHMKFIKSCEAWALEEGISPEERRGRQEAKERIIHTNPTHDRLDLSNLNLTSLPPHFGELTKLKSLYLGGNKFTSLPPEICKLSGLEHLNLDENQLASIPPEICKLSRLEHLNLDKNQLTSIPSEIKELSSLKNLHLSHNQLASIPSEIKELSNLKTLHLSHNQITSIPPEIKELSNLRTIHISHNQITSIPPEIEEWFSTLMIYDFKPQIERAAAIPGTKITLDGREAARLGDLDKPKKEPDKPATSSRH